MEIEAIAGDFRRSLDETLRTVHKLTAGSESSAETVLCSMNAVLSEVVSTNFAAVESHASLARLYRVLEHAHAALVCECDNLPLLFFARSFAVVIEEAVRQLTDEDEEEDTVPEAVVEEDEEEAVEDEEEEEEATVPLVGETTTVKASDDVNVAPIAVVEPLQAAAVVVVDEEKLQKAHDDVIVADGFGVAVAVEEETGQREKEDDEQSWSSGGTPNEAGLMMMEDSEGEEVREAAGRDDAEQLRESGASASASAESGWTDGTPASASPSAETQLSETSSSTVTTAEEREQREEEQTAAAAAMQEKKWPQDAVEQPQQLQLQQAPPTGDYYAAQATKGRITIYSIPACARKHDVQAFLRPIGPIRSLCLPTRQYDDKPLGYALAKFETNQEADAAVARLNGARLCGEPVTVRRAAFTVTYPDAAEFCPTGADVREHADAFEQPPRFGCGQKELIRERADAPQRFVCNPDAPEFRPSAPIPFIRDHADAVNPEFRQTAPIPFIRDHADAVRYREPTTWDADGVWGSPVQEREFVFPSVRDHADDEPPRFGCNPEARQQMCWDADGVWQEKW